MMRGLLTAIAAFAFGTLAVADAAPGGVPDALALPGEARIAADEGRTRGALQENLARR